jgi:hypothetical protein
LSWFAIDPGSLISWLNRVSVRFSTSGLIASEWMLLCASYNLGVLLRKVWGMRKPRNADEGVWGGLWAGLAWLTPAAVIVYRVTIRPESLLWDTIELFASKHP